MRRLAWFVLPFAAAVLACCVLVPLAWMPRLALACAAAGVGCLLLKDGWRARGRLLCLGAAFGFLWFWGWTAVCLAPADRLADTTAPAEAVVVDYPVPTAYGIRVEVRIRQGLGVNALLYADSDYAGLEPGDEIAFEARFQSSAYLRGEEVAYRTAKGIFLLAYAQDELEVSRPGRTPLLSLPVRWASALQDSLARVLPGDVSGLAAAVVLGSREALSDWDSAALTRAGLSHTVAVSGMHIGFLVGILMILCPGHRRRAALLAIPVMAVFALMTGAGPSVVRAVLMQAMMLLAPLLGRESDGPTSLSAALFVLLLLNPYAAASISLQLSFAAVAGLFLVCGPVMAFLKPLYTWKGEGWLHKLARNAAYFCCATFSATLGALLFTTPLSALYFGSVSLAAPLSSLLTLWAVSGLFLFSLAAGLVGLLHTGLGCLAALPAAVLGRWVLLTARGLGGLAFSAVSLSSVYYRLWLGSVYLMLGAAFLLRRDRPRPILPLCGCVLTLCAAILFTRLSYTGASLTVSALDVGQGSSTALISGGSAALVDCGGNSMDNAGDVAADYFQSMGISRLDLLVLTHFDSDHFNGVEQLFRRMEISAVAIPQVEDATGREAQLRELAQAEGAQVWRIGELSGGTLGECVLTIYPPLGSGTTNEEGLMLLCSAGEYDVLITGDADSAIEAMLVKYFDVPDIELLIVGHHGSASSTSAEFLAAVSPETAIISSGYNIYGHPAADTLARLAQAGVDVYRTDWQGTVTVAISQDSPSAGGGASGTSD